MIAYPANDESASALNLEALGFVLKELPQQRRGE